MKYLILIEEKIAAIIKAILSVILFVIMILMFGCMVSRYFFNKPIIWGDELATYLMVSMTFLGGYVALHSDMLVRVTFVLSLLKPKAEKIVNLIAQIIICLLLAVLGYYGFKVLGTPAVQIQKTVALRIPMIVFYAQIPIMTILMELRMIINIYKGLFPDKKEGEEA